MKKEHEPFIGDVVSAALAIYKAHLESHGLEVAEVCTKAQDKQMAYAAGFLTGVELTFKAIESGAVKEIGQG